MDHEEIRALALTQTPDTTVRFKCPECSSGRRHKTDRCLSVTVERDGHVVFNCWHCGYAGAFNLNQKVNGSYRPQFTKVVPAPVASLKLEVLDNPAYAFLQRRGITKRTAHDCGVVFTPEHWINGTNQRAIGFCYSKSHEEKPYAIKWRGLDHKSFNQSGAATTFYQIDRIKPGDTLVICEGEIDCLSFWQAGIPAVSVPNGAPSKVSTKSSSPMEDKKFAYLWSAKELIDAAQKVIIAVDADAPGEALGEELARRVGRGRCWSIAWPTGCKDANDALVKMGAAYVRDAVKGATPWPVHGLYEAEHFSKGLELLYDSGLVKGAPTGYSDLDLLYSVMPSQLTVVTGIPSMGKSAFVDQLMTNLARTNNWKFAVCSFENEPRIHVAKLLSLFCGKPFFDGFTPRMSRDDKARATEWVQQHFYFLHQADGDRTDIDSIIERLRAAVLRYGINGCVIDPYNYVARNVRDMREDEAVAEMLTKLKIFLKAYDVHGWFVAHPNKLRKQDNGTYAVPGGYDISGAAHWYNIADMGVTVHRPDYAVNLSEVHVWKVRYNWLGSIGKTTLAYDPATGIYSNAKQVFSPAGRSHAAMSQPFE